MTTLFFLTLMSWLGMLISIWVYLDTAIEEHKSSAVTMMVIILNALFFMGFLLQYLKE